MDIKQLERAFKSASLPTAEDEEQHSLVQQLLSSNDTEILRYHYDLLRQQENWSLFCWLRNGFAKRGPQGEDFLLQAFEKEEDPEMRGTIVHILGRMRSKGARPLALRLIASDSASLHHTAAYVLGWVGTAEDVRLLEDLLLRDSESEVRADAATAHFQLVNRIPEAKERALQSLKRGLMQEKEEEVLASIIISLQDILKKRFGMREDIDERKITGDVAKAKVKALAALASIGTT
ncbi:MAG TPA: HEAT repeat domain-containing protein [Archangium sp.]|uniref:HEAT repeat domain-containing protein n=1 Tax=Archangium sp. TaxID=1872627 RepID=UPI002E32C275|nr:HEAT repeat domain-containing protein [Archangium sp.]HEX5752136.1 HEAT repeat domain-containing protein [Archangium sp.]